MGTGIGVLISISCATVARKSYTHAFAGLCARNESRFSFSGTFEISWRGRKVRDMKMRESKNAIMKISC